MNRFFLFTLFLLLSCSSAEPVFNEKTKEQQGPETVNSISPPETDSLLDRKETNGHLSSLLEAYHNRTNRIEEPDQEEVFEGYRIQIYSGKNVNLADSIASKFRAWSDTSLVGDYYPETYTIFKAPNYRVHIGDFYSRQQILPLLKHVKKVFRDAWIVPDRIKPWNVPPESVQIIIKSNLVP